LLTIEDPNRNTVLTNTYNSANQITQQVDGLGNTTNWAYSQTDANDTETVITLPNGSETDEYFQNNLPVKTVTAAGTSLASTSTISYDANDNPSAVTDGNGNTTSYTYNRNGDVLSQTDPLYQTTTFTYDVDNNLTSKVLPSGDTTNYIYNAQNNLTSTTQELPNSQANLVTSFTYNSTYPSLLASATDPNGNTTTYGYNAAGDLTSTTDPLNNSTTYGYDADGRQTTVTSPKGNVLGAKPASFTTTTVLNAQGQPTKVTNPLGQIAHYTYDLDGNKASVTDPNGNITRYAYNLNNQVTKESRANASTLLTSYDSMGNVSSKTDGNNKATTYTYNALNELSSETTPLNETTSYTYDADGNLLTKTNPSNQATTDSYDVDDELTGVTYSDGTTPTVSYTYTSDGLISNMTDGTGTTTYSYDGADRLIGITDGTGSIIGYALDADGNVTTLTYPNGKQVTQTYNTDDELTRVTDWLAHTTSFAYNANSDWTLTNYPDTTKTIDTNGYNNADQLTSIISKQKTNTIYSEKYTLDRNGQVTGSTSTGLPGTSVNSYGYNNLNQLDSNNSNNYSYDSADNPTQIKGNSGYTYNNGNELTTGPTAGSTSSTNYAYNANGELTSSTPPPTVANPTTYTYDQAGDLLTTASTASTGNAGVNDSYTYDGNGLRQSETVGSTTKQLTWDQSSSVPSLLADDSTSIIYGPDGLPIEQITGTTPLYYHHDQQGSTVMLTSQAGAEADSYSYDPAGNLTGSTGTTKPILGYDGELTDWDTGLIYLQARVYDPSISQFLTRDPLDAQTGQAYEYAGDNPIDNSDPSGLWFGSSIINGIGNGLSSGYNAASSVTKNFIDNHTIGYCVNGSAGLGSWATASACVDLVGGHLKTTESAGGGGTTITASITGGPVISNANTLNQLKGKFATAGGSAGEVGVIGNDYSWGLTDDACGNRIWEDEPNAGLGFNFPIPAPVEGHVGATYTWGQSW
jgi:RHS repeat-associated protein